MTTFEQQIMAACIDATREFDDTIEPLMHPSTRTNESFRRGNHLQDWFKAVLYTALVAAAADDNEAADCIDTLNECITQARQAVTEYQLKGVSSNVVMFKR